MIIAKNCFSESVLDNFVYKFFELLSQRWFAQIGISGRAGFWSASTRVIIGEYKQQKKKLKTLSFEAPQATSPMPELKRYNAGAVSRHIFLRNIRSKYIERGK